MILFELLPGCYDTTENNSGIEINIEKFEGEFRVLPAASQSSVKDSLSTNKMLDPP